MYPDWVIGLVRECATLHCDVGDAKAAALDRVRSHEEFESLVDCLVTRAIHDMVYSARHSINQDIRGRTPPVGRPSAMEATSPAVNRVSAMYLNAVQYKIGGRILGRLTRPDLLVIAANETQIANGHVFNSLLCRQLAERMQGDRIIVQNAFGRQELNRIFENLHRSICGTQPVAAAGN